MKKLKKAVLAVLSTVLVVGNINAVFADGDISVRMNGIVSNDVSYINFTDTKPIQIDNRTLTPARAMAEAAGMEVEWDQPTQTALLTLKADANSDRPIERFASEAINKIDGLGLDMTPTSFFTFYRLVAVKKATVNNLAVCYLCGIVANHIFRYQAFVECTLHTTSVPIGRGNIKTFAAPVRHIGNTDCTQSHLQVLAQSPSGS